MTSPILFFWNWMQDGWMENLLWIQVDEGQFKFNWQNWVKMNYKKNESESGNEFNWIELILLISSDKLFAVDLFTSLRMTIHKLIFSLLGEKSSPLAEFGIFKCANFASLLICFYNWWWWFCLCRKGKIFAFFNSFRIKKVFNWF